LRLIKGVWEDELGEVEITAGHVWRNQPGEIHAIEDSQILEVSRPEVHDIVRLAGRYGRAP
jgi:hypothetical protein